MQILNRRVQLAIRYRVLLQATALHAWLELCIDHAHVGDTLVWRHIVRIFIFVVLLKPQLAEGYHCGIDIVVTPVRGDLLLCRRFHGLCTRHGWR